jgi:hypothetical protein
VGEILVELPLSLVNKGIAFMGIAWSQYYSYKNNRGLKGFKKPIAPNKRENKG